MQKRSIKIGNYNTAETGLWTLTAWELAPAEADTNLVKVPGGNRPLDLSTALTDGEPSYSGTRPLEITLESSEGNRLERKARIDAMVNQLDGWRLQVWLPDDPDHYLIGRVSVRELYNDLAHCSVQVSVICDSWKYSNAETVVELAASSTAKKAALTNQGRLSVAPLVTVTGGSVALAFGSDSWTLSPGTYQLPALYLRTGEYEITYSGAGDLKFNYREAIL